MIGIVIIVYKSVKIMFHTASVYGAASSSLLFVFGGVLLVISTTLL